MLELMDLIVQSLQFQPGHLAVCVLLSVIGDIPEVQLASQGSLGDFAVGWVALERCCRCRPVRFAFVISGNPLFGKLPVGMCCDLSRLWFACLLQLLCDLQ